MKISKKQLLSAAIIFFFVLSLAAQAKIGVPMNASTTAKAATVPDAGYASEYPNPTQVDVPCIIIGWIYPVANSSVTNSPVYYNLTLTVTNPSGTTQAFFFAESADTATIETSYTPATTGNYSVVLTWPGDSAHAAVTSAPFYFTVQTAALPAIPQNPLPIAEWTYPIPEYDRSWQYISGDWAFVQSGVDQGANNYNPLTTNPMTPHIIWQLQLVEGGLLSDQGNLGVQRPKYTDGISNFVESHGIMYYTREYQGSNAGATGYESDSPAITNGTYTTIFAIDEQTGQELWQTNLPTYNYTTDQYYASAESGGGTPFIVDLSSAKGVAGGLGGEGAYGGGQYGMYAVYVEGGALWKLEPLTGVVEYYNLNSTWGGAKYYNGLWYYSNNGNITAYDAVEDDPEGPNVYNPAPVWTIPIPAGEAGLPTYLCDDYMVWVNSADTIPGASSSAVAWLTTYNATTGVFIANGTTPAYYASSEGSSNAAGDGAYYHHCADGSTRAWSFATGNLLWTSPPQNLPWGLFGNYQASDGDGVCIQASYDGYKYAYNDTNGDLLWAQYTGNNSITGVNPYNQEYPEGSPATWGCAVITNGYVYWSSGEHTPETPPGQGDDEYCNNVLTGQLIWVLPGIQGDRLFDSGIANGILWVFSFYTGIVYAIGQGTTQTTVSASGTIGNANSDGVLIQGKVMDTSPGTIPQQDLPPTTSQAGGMRIDIPPGLAGSTGIPAYADSNQTAAMDWLYLDYPLTVHLMGVPVLLSAIAPDGSVSDITTVTSDSSGSYAYTWTPPGPGQYTIVASFQGSNSYYASYDETAVSIAAAPAATATPTATPTSVANMYFVPAIAGLFVLIIIVAIILALLMLRKRA